MKTILPAKAILPLIFAFTIATATAQSKVHFQSYRDGFKTYGFVDGTRLDSVKAIYATIGWNNDRQVWFDYGQYRDGKSEMRVKDQQGLVYEFEGYSLSFILNFFYHNGWEVQQIVPATNTTTTSTQEIYLLKKRPL